jgi:uncharacterized membrane protein
VEVIGLPLHPLVVHAVVVLLPLASLGALAVLVSGWVRDRYGWLTVAFAIAAAGSAIVARVSGEALEASLGVGPLVATHRSFGELVPYPSVALALLLPAALLLRRRSPVGWRVTAVLVALAAASALVLVVLTGHSGATAVWGA